MKNKSKNKPVDNTTGLSISFNNDLTNKVGKKDIIDIAHGGTGATTVAGARNALGLGNTSGAVPVANGGTGATTVAAARNALGLGNTSGAVPVANGGTGATSAASARTNLGVAPINHATTATGYGVGNSVNYGHLKLSDSTSSTSSTDSGIAATPAAVRSVYNAIANKVLWKANAADSPTGAWEDMKYPLCVRSFIVTCNSGSTKATTFTKFPNAALWAIAVCSQGNFGSVSTVDVYSYSNGSITVHQINEASAAMQIRVVIFGY